MKQTNRHFTADSNPAQATNKHSPGQPPGPSHTRTQRPRTRHTNQTNRDPIPTPQHMMAAQLVNEKSWTIMEKYFPNATKMFDQMVKDMNNKQL